MLAGGALLKLQLLLTVLAIGACLAALSMIWFVRWRRRYAARINASSEWGMESGSYQACRM